MVPTNLFIFLLNGNIFQHIEHIETDHFTVLPEAFGRVTSILAGNLGEVFKVART
jgi:hypothetical protein